MSNYLLFFAWFCLIFGGSIWFFPDTDMDIAAVVGVVFGALMVFLQTSYKDDGNDNGSVYN